MGSKKTKKGSINRQKKTQKNIVADSWKKQYPVWRFGKCDSEHEKWGVGIKENLYVDIIGKLISYETMTWSEIDKITNDKGKSKHHFVEVKNFIKEAQDRLRSLNITDDTLYSFALTNKLRLYGILSDGIYQIVWCDTEHEIYPTKKRGT